MKCQILFSGQNIRKIHDLNMSSAENLTQACFTALNYFVSLCV